MRAKILLGALAAMFARDGEACPKLSRDDYEPRRGTAADEPAKLRAQAKAGTKRARKRARRLREAARD